MTETIAAPKVTLQDQRIADRISAAGQLIEAARQDPEIAAIMANYGYDGLAFDVGQAHQQAAQGAFNARQTAMAARDQAALALKEARAAVRRTYANFRRVARAIYTDTTDRTALALRGNIPGDDQKFLTLVRASYAAAAIAPYQTKLATYGYPVETLTDMVAELDAFSAADDAQNTAAAAAKQATADRNAAVKEMDAWVRQFTAIARVSLKDRPDLIDKLLL